jgi:hypothetical protein
MRAIVLSAIILAACLSQADAGPNPFLKRRLACLANVCEYPTANGREACYLQGQETVGRPSKFKNEPLQCICIINFEKHWGVVTQRVLNCGPA